jgi:hypothetical protein
VSKRPFEIRPNLYLAFMIINSETGEYDIINIRAHNMQEAWKKANKVWDKLGWGEDHPATLLGHIV